MLQTQILSSDRKLEQDASLIFARAGPPAVRFVYDWISIHKHDIHRVENLTRHDQASDHYALGPEVPLKETFHCCSRHIRVVSMLSKERSEPVSFASSVLQRHAFLNDMSTHRAAHPPYLCP